jgi:hypothetical protein
MWTAKIQAYDNAFFKVNVPDSGFMREKNIIFYQRVRVFENENICNNNELK